MQYTTAAVWNTSLISTAIQNAGISYKDPMIIRQTIFITSAACQIWGLGDS